MAPRTRLASTLDPAKVEHAGVAVGSGRSLAQNRLVVTADAVDAAASAAAAATSAAAAATQAAAAATQAANALTSAGNADISEAAALAAQASAAASAAAAAALVADDAVTNAKLRNSVGLSVIGRSANTTGDPGDIVGTDGQLLRVSGTTLGFGTAATAGIANNAVTLGKMATVATATFLGRVTASTGNVEALTVAQMRTAIGAGFYAELTGAAFTGNVTMTNAAGNAVFGVFGSAAAFVRMGDTGAGANLKYHDILVDGGSLTFRNLNDDTSVKNTPMYFGATGFVVVPNYMFVGEGGGSGQLRLNSGSVSTAPWVGWYNSAGLRLGYIGDSNTNLLVALENNAAFSISGGPVQLPAWNTAGRPASPQDGYFGRNTTLGHPEMYMSGKWLPMSSGQVIDASGVAVVDLTIPAGPTIIRIHGGYTYSVANAHKLGFRRSVDNGASYLAGASDYAYNGHYSWGASHASHGAMTFTTYGPISSVDQALGDFYCYFDVMFFVGDGSRQSSWFAHSTGYNSSNSWQGQISGYSFATSTNTRWTNLRLLGSSGHNFTRILATVEYLA